MSAYQGDTSTPRRAMSSRNSVAPNFAGAYGPSPVDELHLTRPIVIAECIYRVNIHRQEMPAFFLIKNITYQLKDYVKARLYREK